MKYQKIPVDRKVQNIDLLNQDNSSILSVSSLKKAKYIKLLGLLASFSSVGMVLSGNQLAEAKTVESSKKEQHFAEEAISLADFPLKIEDTPILNHDQNGTKILQLPSLQVAQAQENKATKKATKKVYTVKLGDTISSIARQHGISSSQIISANQLSNPNFIKINHQLVIPYTEIAQENREQKAETTNQLSAKDRFSGKNEMIISDATPSAFSSLMEKKAESRDRKTVETTVDNSSSNQESAANAATTTATNNTENPYISKLRQDIVKLRTKYQQQSGANEAIGGSAQENITATTSNTAIEEISVKTTSETQIAPIENIEDRSDSQIEKAIAPNSVAVENFDSLVSLSKVNSDIPNLPPLSSPEEYLPENPVFNGYIWPAKGTLTSGYGWRWGRMHKGIDIAAPVGTPIMAAASGEVVFAGWNSGGYGNLVKLKHHDGSITFYAHNHRVLVSNGQKVKQGQLIAEMGSTGRSTGPHLHFEIRPEGSAAINPMARLPKN